MQTDIDYPDSLPCFLRDGYALNYADNILRVDDSLALSAQRQAQENIPIVAEVSILATAAQAQEFEQWYKHTVKGIKWFNAKLRSEMGYDDNTCRFIERYAGPELIGGNMWRYKFKLEIYKQPVFSRDWYEYGFDFIENASIFDIAMNREWPEP